MSNAPWVGTELQTARAAGGQPRAAFPAELGEGVPVAGIKFRRSLLACIAELSLGLKPPPGVLGTLMKTYEQRLGDKFFYR